MNKNDFRLQIPLWNIALWCILIIWTYGVAYSADILFSNFEGVFIVVDNEFTINWHLPGILSIIIGSILLVVFFLSYFIKLKQYNSKNPNNKMAPITFLKPGEFLEDDEMLRRVTENAAKKVYIFYSFAIPLLISIIIIFPFERYLYIVLLFLLLIVHNALYYREIRKFISGEYTLNTRTQINYKIQKLLTVIVIVGFILVITIPSFRIIQIDNNHTESLQKFEACIKIGKSATMEVEKNGFTSVICE